jgi:hypothetical protein
VNAIRSGRRAPSTVAAGDEPRVNCLQGHKIAAQGFLASVLRDEVRCATGPGRELRRSPLPRTPVNRATEKAGAVRSPGSLCASPTLPCMPLNFLATFASVVLTAILPTLVAQRWFAPHQTQEAAR